MVRLCTNNIQNNPDMPRRLVRMAARLTAHESGIAAFQEIGEGGEDMEDVLWGMGRAFHHVHENLQVPIFWRHRFYRLALPRELPHGVKPYGYEWAHPAKAGTSYRRPTAWAFLKKRGDRALPPIVASNRHRVNGAFSKPGQTNEGWRDWAWMEHEKLDEDLSREWYNLGISQIIFGDFNRKDTPKIAPKMEWVYPDKIDYIGFSTAPEGARFRLTRRTSFPDPGDHDGLVAHGRLLPPAR